jgi:hypothetical protein
MYGEFDDDDVVTLELQILNHTTYSQNLAPSENHLFEPMKEQPKRPRF